MARTKELEPPVPMPVKVPQAGVPKVLPKTGEDKTSIDPLRLQVDLGIAALATAGFEARDRVTSASLGSDAIIRLQQLAGNDAVTKVLQTFDKPVSLPTPPTVTPPVSETPPPKPGTAAEPPAPAVQGDELQTEETGKTAAPPAGVITPAGAPPAKGPRTAAALPGAPQPAAVAGDSSLSNWKAGVKGATQGISKPKLQSGPQVSKIQQTGAQSVGKHKEGAKGLMKDGQSAIPPAPGVKDPPPIAPANVDLVPEATKLVADASYLGLPQQTMPPLEESPQHNMPTLTLPAPPEAPKTDQPPAGAEKPAATSEKPKEPGKEQADKVNKAAEKPPEPVPLKGKGAAGEFVFEDKGAAPPPEPEMPPVFKASMAAVLAQLMTDPKAEAQDMMKQIRSSAYNGALQEQFPNIGDTLLDGLADSLKEEINSIAREMGVSEKELSAAVTKRQQELQAQKDQASKDVNGAEDEEKKKLKQAGADTLDQIAATREALDKNTEDKLAAAKGDNDPEVIKLKRDRLIRDAEVKVAKQIIYYDDAGKKRKSEIAQTATLQKIAYANAAKLDEQKLLKTAGNNASIISSSKLIAAISYNWSEAKARSLDKLVREKHNEADGFVKAKQDGVRDARVQAVEEVRGWADEKLNQHRTWLDKLLERIRDWSNAAKAEAEAWEAKKNHATGTAIVADMNFLGGVVMTAGDQLSEDAKKKLDTLNAEQRAIVSTYYGLGPDGQPLAGAKDAKNPIAAVAAGVRVRIMSQRTPKIREQFETELDKTPGADWPKLDALAKADNPTFSAAHVASEINQALHGGLVGWNDEGRVFRALAGLSKVGSMALHRVYRLPPSSGGYGRDLDEDIQDQLSGAEETRAKALIAGDQTLADVATLREAMHGGITGWGTDEKAIMETLRNKSPEEREKIKKLYFEKYHKDLEEDLKEELTGTFEDEHDDARAQALMEGDTHKADAIAIDQAMYGGLTGLGTDRKAIEDVYKQVREDTERELHAQARRTGKTLTTKELEAEVAKRYRQVEASYNATYQDKWGPGEESALRRAYKDELSDGELALVNAIADNDLTKADAARIQVEKESVLADDDVINGVLKHQYERALEELKRDKGPALYEDLEKRRLEAQKAGKPWDPYRLKKEQHEIERQLEEEAKKQGKTYMTQLENTYDTDFGSTGKGSLKVVIEKNMDGEEKKEARKLLAQGGWLTPAQQIHFATEGLGTKEEAFKKAFEGRTKEEIDEIRKEWEKLHPGESLEQRIDSETSGRLNFELHHKLKGEPMSMQEEMESAKELAKHEQEHDSSWFSSDERARMDFRMAQMQAKYDAANVPGLSDPERAKRVAEFQQFAGYANVSINEHKEKLEAVTGSLVTAVTTAIAVVVAAIAIIFSGGTATPGVMAAFAAWAGTAGGAATIAMGTALIGMGIKQVMLGSDYGIEDVGTDFAVGGVEAIAAAATAGLSKALFLSRAEKLVEGLGKGLTTAERTALMAALEKQPQFAKGWFATMAQSTKMSNRMLAHGLSGATFGAAGAVPSGLARTMLDSKTWEGGGAWEKILTGTGEGVLQGTIAGAGMGAVGGIKSPHAPGHLPGAGKETVTPPTERELLPPGGAHTSETLKTGLPPDLQKKVPIHVDPELESNTVRVHYDVDEHGVIKDIHVRAGPTATPRDIELHTNTIRTMQKYSGLQGRVRALIRRVRSWVSKNGPPAPGSKAWEAKLEVEKLPAIIEDHVQRLTDPELDPQVRSQLEAEVDGLRSQLAEHESTLKTAMPEEEGLGYVAAEGSAKRGKRGKGKGEAEAPEEQPPQTKKPSEKKAAKKGAAAAKPEDPVTAAAKQAEANNPPQESLEKAPPSPEKSRAEKVTELSGEASSAQTELDRINSKVNELERANLQFEREQEAFLKKHPEGKFSEEKIAGYEHREEQIAKMLNRREALWAELRDIRSKLAELAGTPEERAKWDEHTYGDLGSKKVNPCFAPGTLVHTPTGVRRIEELIEGDSVSTWNFTAQCVTARRVMNVIRNSTSHLQNVRLEHDVIQSTRLHRFWSEQDQQWKQARKLWQGETLHSLLGVGVSIVSTEHAFCSSPTFNLEIEETHNYFVGTTGVLVHNGEADDLAGIEIGTSKFISGERQPTRIYLILKKNPQTGVMEPFYVGKTFQGELGDVKQRFKQHLQKKGEWKAAYEGNNLSDPVAIMEGNWTEFETAVWEEHYIRQLGGLQKENGKLANARHELDPETYEKYRDGYGHNPCAGK